MKRLPLAALLVLAACGPETTSFRSTDRGPGVEQTGPRAAAVDVRGVAVRVSSYGGYIGSSDEPMTHVGFELRNTGTTPVKFDGDALRLELADKYGAPLPPAAFTAVTPLGPAVVALPAGTTTALDAYFRLPVRPRVVGSMRVRWTLGFGAERVEQTTSFVRDDDFPIAEPPPQELRPPRAAAR